MALVLITHGEDICITLASDGDVISSQFPNLWHSFLDVEVV